MVEGISGKLKGKRERAFRGHEMKICVVAESISKTTKAREDVTIV